jgi:hypothetical protein
VRKNGKIIWSIALKWPIVRSRGCAPQSLRDIEKIGKDEFVEALRLIVEAIFGMEQKRIPDHGSSAFGFVRRVADRKNLVRAWREGDPDGLGVVGAFSHCHRLLGGGLAF